MYRADIALVTGLLVLWIYPLPSQNAEIKLENLQADSVSRAVEISATTLQRLPQRGLEAVLEIQPAVVVQDAEMHVLGGRDDETGFYLNGMPLIDPITNHPLMHIIPEAISRIDLYTSGYPVYFGNANSGLVNTVLKTGTAQHHFSVDYQTDKFAESGNKFLNTYSYRDQIVSSTVSGPFFSDKLRYFVALENEQIGDTQKRYSKGFTIYDLYESRYTPPEEPMGPIFRREESTGDRVSDNSDAATVISQMDREPDSLAKLTYPDGFTPNNSSKRWAANSTFLYKGVDFSSQLNVMFDHQKLYQDDQPMLHILNDRQQYLINQNWFISGKLEKQLSTRQHFGLNLGYSYKHSERHDDYFGNNWRLWSDSLAVAEHTNGTVQYQNAFASHYDYYLNGFRFERNGTLSNPWYFKQEQQAWFGRLDWQGNWQAHQLRFGSELRTYKIRNYEVHTSRALNLTHQYGSEENIPEQAWHYTIGSQNYGYDALGHKTEKGFDDPRQPLFVSAYLEDRITHENAVLTLGLRYAYFDMDGDALKNPGNPAVNEADAEILDSAWKDQKPEQFFLPRFALSVFNKSGSQIYMHYGKYAQTPKNSLYSFNSNEYGLQIITAGNLYFNPVAFDMDIIQSTVTKFGFKKLFAHVLSFNLGLFFKNSENLPQTKKSRPRCSCIPYIYLGSGDFSKSNGINIQLSSKRARRLQTDINYVYQNTKGTGSYYNSNLTAVYQNSLQPTQGHFLDYAVKHKGAVNLDYRFAKDDGGPIMEQLGINMLFRFDSGHPFSHVYVFPGSGRRSGYNLGVDYMRDHRSRTIIGKFNSSSTPWTYNVDLKIDKTFDISERFNLTLYARVLNLFNRKNVLNVYEFTGYANDDGMINNDQYSGDFKTMNGEEKYTELYQAINIENGQSYWDILGKQLYNHPRQIMFGIRIAY